MPERAPGSRGALRAPRKAMRNLPAKPAYQERVAHFSDTLLEPTENAAVTASTTRAITWNMRA